MASHQTSPHIAIVHVPYLVPGGEERYVRSLAMAYESTGAKVSQWPVSNQGIAASISALTFGKPREWDETYAALKPDFLHLNNLHPTLGAAFLDWIRDRNIPAIATIHNHRFYCTNGLALYAGENCKACRGALLPWRPLLFNCNGNWTKSIYHALSLTRIQNKQLLSSLRALVAPSDYIARELAAVGFSKEQIHVLPHPLSISPETEGVENRKIYDCIYAGRFSEEKGIRFLLKVASALPEKIFAFAGHGPLENEVQAAAISNRNIIFLSELDRPALMDAVRASRAACVPSICEESFSLFGAEALLLGTQTVVAPKESLQWLTKLPFGAIPAEKQEVASFVEALNLAWQAPNPSKAILLQMREDLSVVRYGHALRSIMK